MNEGRFEVTKLTQTWQAVLPFLFLCCGCHTCTHTHSPPHRSLLWSSPPAPSKARSLQQTHRCRLRLVLRGAVPVLSPSEGLSPHTHSGKAITFTPIAGEKLELINLAAGKRSVIYCLIIALVDFPVASSQELCPCLSPPKGHPQDTAQCSADTAEKTVDSISSDTSGTLEARTAAPQLTARAVPGSTGLAGAPRTTVVQSQREHPRLCACTLRGPHPHLRWEGREGNALPTSRIGIVGDSPFASMRCCCFSHPSFPTGLSIALLL